MISTPPLPSASCACWAYILFVPVIVFSLSFLLCTIWNRITKKHWKATWDLKTCEQCKGEHGKIYAINDQPNPEPPLHPNCRCVVEAMDAVAVGLATKDGDMGADWWLRNYGVLPSNYIKEADLRALGWDRGDSPAKYIQGKMVTMGEYRNENAHLLRAPGRVWYEADINYYSGKRNGHRILWSNDGLIFVTYNHYRTFFEVA